MTRPQSWDDCDPDIWAYVVDGLAALGLPLVGAYLHGSLAMGCYYRSNSDLDLLVVVDEPLSESMRAAAARRLADRSAGRPIAGDLELSVLTTAQAVADSHLRPFELHYSGLWTADILAGRIDYHLTRTDPDLAAHITVVRSRGVALLGPPAEVVFAPVSHEDYLAAIIADLGDALEQISASPCYAVLNACRVLAVLAEGPGTVVSKEEGAVWAMDVLPPRHRPVVVQALGCYRSGRPTTCVEGAVIRGRCQEEGRPMTKFVRIVAAAVLVSAVLPSAQRRKLVHPA